MQHLSNPERLARNVERMKGAGASEVEVDRYLVSEGVKSKLVRVWRKPLVQSGAPNAEQAATLKARYGLE